jgi:dipeptidyl aminopeptidase/acylaminoacyl peptidase
VCYLTLPQGIEPKKLPMVLLVHGGPWARDGWGYDAQAQWLANRGYAVLQVNYRGSTGFGKAFVNAANLEWGRRMHDDLIDAVDWAITQRIADPARVGIYGASYGGYSAMMGAIREPTLYRCAVGLSGVYDLAKLFKWGDTHRSDYGKAYLKWARGEDPADLAARSPNKQADRVQIPVLLAHGLLDDRADIKHAHALESALKHNGKPVELIVFGRMGHSILLEDQKQEFYARLLQFLDANIGSGTAAGSR